MVKKFLKDFSGPPVKLKNLKCLKIEQKLHLLVILIRPGVYKIYT